MRKHQGDLGKSEQKSESYLLWMTIPQPDSISLAH